MLNLFHRGLPVYESDKRTAYAKGVANGNVSAHARKNLLEVVSFRKCSQ